MPQLLPPPKFRAVGSDGLALVGGLVYTYSAGTTTPKNSYTSFTMGAANTNPIELDSRGEADIWLDGSYKIRLCDSDNNIIWEVDDVRDLTSLQTFNNATLTGTLTISSTAVTWSGNPTHSGNHTFTSNVTVNGNTTLGNASSDVVTLNADSVAIPNNLEFTGGELTFTPPTDTANPVIAFGGASVGVTYDGLNREIKYWEIGGLYFFAIRIPLTSKGSSTGAATITGLPFTPGGSGGLTEYPVSIKASGMSGLTGALAASAVSGSTTITVVQTAAAGTTSVTDANFTNSTDLHICGFCPA